MSAMGRKLDGTTKSCHFLRKDREATGTWRGIRVDNDLSVSFEGFLVLEIHENFSQLRS